MYGNSPRPPHAPMENLAACNFFATAYKMKQIQRNLGQEFEFLEIGNKCAVGLETSRPEAEKLEAQVSFPQEKVFIPQSDSCLASASGLSYTVRPSNEFCSLTVMQPRPTRPRNENFLSRKRKGREIFHQCTQLRNDQFQSGQFYKLDLNTNGILIIIISFLCLKEPKDLQ